MDTNAIVVHRNETRLMRREAGETPKRAGAK